MPRIALGQDDYSIPIESNIYEDVYAGGDYVAPIVTAPPTSSGSIWDAFTALLSNKPLVNAAANKLVFGSSAAIPQYTNPMAPGYIAPPSTSGYIMGIPTTTLMMGAAGVLLLVMMTGKKGRR